MRQFLAPLFNKKYLFITSLSTFILITYQACSNEPFTAQRLMSLSQNGSIFTLESRKFPVCTNERKLAFTYVKGLHETHYCYDKTNLAAGLTTGPICASGPSIQNFTSTPAVALPCNATTLCGVQPEVTELSMDSLGKSGTGLKGYRLSYSGLPLGCVGTIEVHDGNDHLVQEVDVETPGTKESLCRPCGNNTYSCECQSGGNQTNSGNGICGNSNVQSFPTPPTTNLCEVGIATTVAKDSGKFIWTCVGTNGGSNAFCSATNTTYASGICGSAFQDLYANAPTTNLCNRGTATTVKVEQDKFWRWDCQGIDGGPAAICWAHKVTSTTVVNGSCGNANGQSHQVPPSTNLCNTGNPGTVVTNPNTFNWTCDGSNGGTTANCQSTRVLPM